MEEIIFLVLGLIWGSFLNVVIYRLPIGKNIVVPRSFCPGCGKTIKFYDNIPVISYIILLGKCRYCKVKISWLYPLVELLTAFGFWLAYTTYFTAFPVHTGFTILFICLLIALAFIDYRHQILPDEITLGGAVIFLVYSFFHPELTPINGIGTAIGSALFFLGVYFFYLKVRKIEGLGLGDVKMMLLLGAFLGINKLVIALLISSFSGVLVGLFFILFKGKDMKIRLPFGTFLSLGSFISLFWGMQILGKIQSLIHF
jgi:leader peptidase (prepilin peptidase)/N-methyltransferase